MAEKKEKPKEITNKISAIFSNEKVVAEENNESRELHNQSKFGELQEGKFYYSLVEALYLLEKKRMDILDNKNKKINADDFIKKAREVEPNFWIRYVVFRDMRNRGYIVKTALKFGADFRVYDRGVKPGDDHAKWILYPVHEASVSTWYEFSAKNRVAHSTRKRLLIGIVDDENDVTYYNVEWVRP
ncbi:tRNA-intron lyase [Candidatus Woesearchaeota archaeon]|nr:tRNA-intron lyase [Candidatus Woesearchaeota archaeon]